MKQRAAASTEGSHKRRVAKQKAERRRLALQRLSERQARKEKVEMQRKKRKNAAIMKQRRAEELERAATEAAEKAKAAAEKAESEAIKEGKSQLEVITAAAKAATEVVEMQVPANESDSGESLSDCSINESDEEDEFAGIELVAKEVEEDQEKAREAAEIPTVVEITSETSETVSSTFSLAEVTEKPKRKSQFKVGFYAAPPPKEVIVKKTVVKRATCTTERKGGTTMKKATQISVVEEKEEVVDGPVVLSTGGEETTANAREDREAEKFEPEDANDVDILYGRVSSKNNGAIDLKNAHKTSQGARVDVNKEEAAKEAAVTSEAETRSTTTATTTTATATTIKNTATNDTKNYANGEIEYESEKRAAAAIEVERSARMISDDVATQQQDSLHKNIKSAPADAEIEEEAGRKLAIGEARTNATAAANDAKDGDVNDGIKNEEVETEPATWKVDTAVVPTRVVTNGAEAESLSESSRGAEAKDSDAAIESKAVDVQGNADKGRVARSKAFSFRVGRMERIALRMEAEGDFLGAEREYLKILKIDGSNVGISQRLTDVRNHMGKEVASLEQTQGHMKEEAEEELAAAAKIGNEEMNTENGSPPIPDPTSSSVHISSSTPNHVQGDKKGAVEESLPQTSLPSPLSSPPSSSASLKPLPVANIKDVKEVAESFSSRGARIDAARERQSNGWTPRKELTESLGKDLSHLVPVPPLKEKNDEASKCSGKPPKIPTCRGRESGDDVVVEDESLERNNGKNDGGDGNGTKFTDIYPHFSTIFSAWHERDVVSSTSNSHVAPSSSAGSRRSTLTPAELAASMHWQWWLYSVFGQVMEDYTTVFSTCEKGKSGGRKGANCQRGNNADSDTDDSDNDALDWSPDLEMKENGQKAFYAGGKESLLFRVNSSRAEVYNIVSDVLHNSPPWVELPVGLDLKTSWNLLWSWSKPKVDFSSLLVWQKVNHFRHARALTRKDLLKKHIQRFCATVGGTNLRSTSAINVSAPKASAQGELWNLMPQTFALPQEFNNFVKAFSTGQQENPNRNFWIIKPVGMSRGRGISVINDIGNVSYSEQVVCQKYITNPLLLDGYKFDLRIYILVTSFQPLESFIFREGFARMSSKKFSLNAGDICDRMVHLTNASIQKNARDDFAADNPAKASGERGGSKISLTYLWKRLAAIGVDTTILWQKISDLCLKTLMVAEDSIPFQPNSFEVFGFDVMIDENLDCWLIEVNASPAMARETRLDEQIKEAMIHDTIKIVSPPKFDRAALVKVCERRMHEIQRKQSHKANFGKSSQGFSSEKEQLEDDLSKVLMGEMPRPYGELPKDIGSYQRMSPNEKAYEKLKKARSKMFSYKVR